MTELFNIYEDSFKNLINKGSKITDNFSSIKDEYKEQTLKDAEHCLIDSDRIHMDLENVKLPNTIKKQEVELKIKSNKYEYDTLYKRLQKTIENHRTNNKREELLSKSKKDLKIGFKSEDTNNEAINHKITLENSKIKMIQMESVSMNIMEKLNRNNENLLNVNNKVDILHKELNTGLFIIKRIFRKENKNKLVVFGFTLALIIIFILFISNKFQLQSQ